MSATKNQKLAAADAAAEKALKPLMDWVGKSSDEAVKMLQKRSVCVDTFAAAVTFNTFLNTLIKVGERAAQTSPARLPQDVTILLTKARHLRKQMDEFCPYLTNRAQYEFECEQNKPKGEK